MSARRQERRDQLHVEAKRIRLKQNRRKRLRRKRAFKREQDELGKMRAIPADYFAK